MTMRVNGPGGIVVNFPDGTDAQTVDKVMREAVGVTGESKVSHAQSQFDNAPFYAKPFIAAHDLAKIGADTLSGGYADKVGAYFDQRGAPDVGPHDNPQAYENVLSRNRQMTTDAYERAGLAGVGASAVSLLSPMGAASRGAGLLKAAPAFVKNGARYLAPAIGGAGYGGFSAAGHDEEIGEGIFYGGAFGAGGQALGHAIGNATQYAGKLLKQWGYGTPQQAAHKILELAQSMGLTAPAAKQRMAELGPEGMLVDLLGKPGTSMGRAAANVSPEAREIIETATSARKAGQNERIVGTMEDATGLPRGSRLTVEELNKQTYNQASPEINRAYNAARAAGYDLPRTPFESVLKSPMGSEAYDHAAKSLLNRTAISGEDAASELARLDMTKRILDSKASAARRAGDYNTADEAAGLARTLREQMDASIAGPEYSQARALRRDLYGKESAIKMGDKLAGGRIAANLPKLAGKVPEENRGLLGKAYAVKQSENLLNRNSTEGALNRLSTPLAKEASNAALGPNAPKLNMALANERTFNATHRELTGNSTTARQFMDVLGGTGVGLLGAYTTGQDLMTGGITGALLGAGRRYAPLLTARIASNKKRALAPEIAGLLTRRALPNTPVPRGVVPLLGQAIEKLSKAKKDALARALAVNSVAYGTNRGVP